MQEMARTCSDRESLKILTEYIDEKRKVVLEVPEIDSLPQIQSQLGIVTVKFLKVNLLAA